MTPSFAIQGLSPAAVDVLGQLFVSGPTWDGNIVSKSGRCELVRAGLAEHAFGWAFLTHEGVRVAVEWDRQELRDRGSVRWHQKARVLA